MQEKRHGREDAARHDESFDSRLTGLHFEVDGQRLDVRSESRFRPGTEVGDFLLAYMTDVEKKTRDKALTRILRRAGIKSKADGNVWIAVNKVFGDYTPKEFEDDPNALYGKLARAIGGEVRRGKFGPGYSRRKRGGDVVRVHDPKDDKAGTDTDHMRNRALKLAISRLGKKEQRLAGLLQHGLTAPEIARLESTTPVAARKRIERLKRSLAGD